MTKDSCEDRLTQLKNKEQKRERETRMERKEDKIAVLYNLQLEFAVKIPHV